MASTKDVRPTSSSPDFSKVGTTYILSQEIDFTDTDNQLAQNETMSVFDIPANCHVRGFMKVTTADADITDVDLGMTTDGTTSASLFDGVSLASTGYVQNATALDAFTTAASIVVLTNKDAQTINQAVVKVIVEVTPLY